MKAVDLYKRISELESENSRLTARNKELTQANTTLLKENQQLKSRVSELEQSLKELQKIIFGKSSEKKKNSSKPRINKPRQNKFKGGEEADEEEAPKDAFPEHLRREFIDLDDLPDGADPNDYTLVGTKITERLACKPAEFYVIVTRRKVYKKKDTGEFVTPPAPEHPLDRCMADVSLIVFLIIQKCLYHLPLYRQYQMLKINGIKIKRNNLASWVIKISELLTPVVKELENNIKLSKTVHCDETPGLVNFKIPGEKKKYRRSYFWTLLSTDIGVVFKWTKTRTNADAEDVLSGITGTLTSDALNIYTHCVKKFNLSWQICWVHIRRNFLKVSSSNEEIAEKFLEPIQKLLILDKKIRRRTKNPILLIRWRNRFVKPKADKIRELIDSYKNTPEVQTDSTLLEAINYIDSRWEYATTFLTHPLVLPHNNNAELMFRQLKLGVKNWLFASSEIGAETVANLYSLLYSAKMHGINPYYYLHDILKQIEVPGVKAKDLVPHVWKHNREKIVVPPHLQADNILK